MAAVSTPVLVWNRVPLFLYILAISGLSMVPPALLAFMDSGPAAALPFVVGTVIVIVIAALLALALNNRAPRLPVREHLMALLGTFTVIPVLLGWVFASAVDDIRFIDALLEVTSAITTTGLTVESDPEAWSRPVHLWRCILGWLGGLLIWVAAIAILAPLHIGGFELLLPRQDRSRHYTRLLGDRAISPARRVARAFDALAKVYLVLTSALWLLLLMAGEMPFVALCHAMSTLSTSGISPVGGLSGGDAGILGEMVIFGFFIFAISRRTFANDLPQFGRSGLLRDPEIRVAVTAIVLVTVVLFVRHWYALVETAEIIGLSLIPRAVWGAVFTSASFLTTTGFISSEWEIARLWSGLSTPGMVLMGLSVFGGGVATTAGGVKLLRIYVLYKHGQREVSRLAHPSAVGGIGTRKRPVSQQAALMAWLFFMLMALSITLSMMAFAFAGQSFEVSTILTIAAITNNGPLLDIASVVPLRTVEFSDTVKYFMCAAMAFGRLETLAIIALFNPDFWRR